MHRSLLKISDYLAACRGSQTDGALAPHHRELLQTSTILRVIAIFDFPIMFAPFPRNCDTNVTETPRGAVILLSLPTLKHCTE